MRAWRTREEEAGGNAEVIEETVSSTGEEGLKVMEPE